MITTVSAERLIKQLDLAAVQLDDAAGKLADWEDLKSANACAVRAMRCRHEAKTGRAAIEMRRKLQHK